MGPSDGSRGGTVVVMATEDVVLFRKISAVPESYGHLCFFLSVDVVVLFRLLLLILYRFSIQNTEAAQLWQAFDPQAFPESPQVVLIQAKFVSKLNKDRQMLRHYQPCKKQQSISDWYDDWTHSLRFLKSDIKTKNKCVTLTYSSCDQQRPQRIRALLSMLHITCEVKECDLHQTKHLISFEYTVCKTVWRHVFSRHQDENERGLNVQRSPLIKLRCSHGDSEYRQFSTSELQQRANGCGYYKTPRLWRIFIIIITNNPRGKQLSHYVRAETQYWNRSVLPEAKCERVHVYVHTLGCSQLLFIGGTESDREGEDSAIFFLMPSHPVAFLRNLLLRSRVTL
ncbi:hypothetical protein F2P81_017273 [Scophthalmus maximus]|uniref:Uncharacterized protein n=1 Tax=Scophthalmus maximus TaxID=52904 RepID=A0A6A4SJK8_SCOMX|nr:hypothetical protein F2P81_017273 [Scophthalmus maximus]